MPVHGLDSDDAEVDAKIVGPAQDVLRFKLLADPHWLGCKKEWHPTAEQANITVPRPDAQPFTSTPPRHAVRFDAEFRLELEAAQDDGYVVAGVELVRSDPPDPQLVECLTSAMKGLEIVAQRPRAIPPGDRLRLQWEVRVSKLVEL